MRLGTKLTRALAWASLASNMLIVVTGGAVRLTGSGLGCPTWPTCTADSLIAVPEMGIHGLIEFGNRLLTFVLALIALATFIALRRLGPGRPRRSHALALSLGLGIIAQALLGGVTVLTGLNPWVVGLHFVLSGVLITLAVDLVWIVYKGDSPTGARGLSLYTTAVGYIAVIMGIVVTGAGPHAGDAETPRNGLDLATWQHFHSYPGYALLVLVLVQLLISARQRSVSQEAGGSPNLSRKTVFRIQIWLLLAVSAQALLGIAQSRMGVPPELVLLHMLGATVIIALLRANELACRAEATANAAK